MAEYPGVNLSAAAEAGPCDHPGIEPAGVLEYATADIPGVYPYEASIRVYVRFADDTEETVYTSTGGLAGNYIGSVELVTPTSARLRVQRLDGWPVGALRVYVERA